MTQDGSEARIAFRKRLTATRQQRVFTSSWPQLLNLKWRVMGEISLQQSLQSRHSLQTRVFHLGLLQDWDARVGVCPEREKVLVSSLGLSLVAGQHKRSA